MVEYTTRLFATKRRQNDRGEAMKKRLLTVLLALVMLMQCACALVEEEATAKVENDIISSDNSTVSRLNAEGEQTTSVPAVAVAYVRGGKYSDMTYAEVGAATKTSDILVSKNDTGNGAENGDISRDNSRQFFV